MVKVLNLPVAVEETARISARLVVYLGIVELICLAALLTPYGRA
jgi:hypothetical protein